jgi:hypothetical protein
VKEDNSEPIRTPWAFDTSGPSKIGQQLERSRRISERNAREDRSKTVYAGWSIGKTDPNEQFNKLNSAQFGTRQRRKIR